VISAPFKAIGKLFGAGKNDNKPRRLSEKDVKNLSRTVKVVDAALVNTPESMGMAQISPGNRRDCDE
jgi:hypothetical protein